MQTAEYRSPSHSSGVDILHDLDGPPIGSPVQAPTDDELYWYLGPQRRWVQITMTCSFLLAAASLLRFSANSIWLFPFLIVLGVNISGSILSAISGLNQRRISHKSHGELVASWDPSIVPTVDVFLPTCGEPLDVLENTYWHVQRLSWRGSLTVWVLDDADRPEVRDKALAAGFRYEVRPDRGYMKKAGNLRFAYEQSVAEHIVILDADFCPRADFLLHLMPYMDDPAVGIVQSPQAFDTRRDMPWLQRTAGATQELFYRWVQPSRDRAGAPICVGTCAVYRRAALEAAGGFAQISHSEDVHTGIALLRVGYATRYVPIVVSKGLCPDTLAGFLNQQYRWCNGSMTLLKSGEAQRHPLSWRQRMCFWAGFMYYISTAVNVFAAHAPGIVMAFFYPDQVKAAHYVPFLAGAWVYMVLLPMVSKSRWRFEVMRVQMAYAFAHSVALVHRLTNRTAGWVATGAVGKGSQLAVTISWIGLTTISLNFVLAWVGIAMNIPRYGLKDFWPMVFFQLIFTYLSMPLAYGFFKILRDARRGRRAERVAVVVDSSVAIQLPRARHGDLVLSGGEG